MSVLTPKLQDQIDNEFGRELKGKINEQVLLILLYKNYESFQESKASRSFGFRGRKDRINVKEGITTRVMSEELSIPQSTIATIVKRLSPKTEPPKTNGAIIQYVKHSKGAPIKTTEAGRERAKMHLRHHRLLEFWLVESLGMSVEQSHEEAMKLMLILDCDMISQIDNRYGHPKVCPCGEDIPESSLCDG